MIKSKSLPSFRSKKLVNNKIKFIGLILTLVFLQQEILDKNYFNSGKY